METSKELLLSSITQFYDKNPCYKNLLDTIIEGQYSISLRVIDWFITHYSKERNIMFWINTTNRSIIETPIEYGPNLKKFSIYLEYRAQLKSYTKLFFDPFRRHERISFIVTKKPLKTFETTIGQLNFFRWIFQNHILSYIQNHLEEIETAMTKYQSSKKESTKPKSKKQSRVIPNNTITQTKCFLRFD
jgi:hypothetical protein